MKRNGRRAAATTIGRSARERAARRVHIYGPVPSRRLGYSLGVDLLPFKTCSMDCVYCQLGSHGPTTIRRREYVPVRTVLRQIREALASGKTIDSITFSGSGEPLLHSGIASIIAGIRRMTDVRIVVLTNSSCLASPGGRRAVLDADIVVPSLDAATQKVFTRVNRPHRGLTAAGIIVGLEKFRRAFRGQIWLEIMLVKGLNDGPAQLRSFKTAIARIDPDRIQLNTVVRPPAEEAARPLNRGELEAVREFLGDKAEIIAEFSREGGTRAPSDPEAAIVDTLRRRPMTANDLSRSLALPLEDVLARLRRLEIRGQTRSRRHGRDVYFEPA